MDVVEQTDLVGSLRKLANVEQPGLFDDSSSLEAVLAGFAIVFAAAALAGELGTEPAFELGTADAGFATELVDGAGFGVCAGLGVAVPVEA